MSIVWVVITDRCYDGDTLYGVFNSKERAENALRECSDEDAVVKRVTINELLHVRGDMR